MLSQLSFCLFLCFFTSTVFLRILRFKTYIKASKVDQQVTAQKPEDLSLKPETHTVEGAQEDP